MVFWELSLKMYLRLASISLLLSLFFFQSQGDLFRKHYEAANAAHRAGNFAAAEAEFKAILGRGLRATRQDLFGAG